MTEKKIQIFLISLNSIMIWDILVKMHLMSGKMQTMLIVLSLVPLIYSSFLLLNDFKFENSYFKFIFTLFLCYELVTVIRGWSFAYADIKLFMQTPYVLWPFIIPLFIFFDKKIEIFSLFFRWIYYIALFFLFLACVYPPILLRRVSAETYINFFIPCGFLLLNATYLNDRKVNVSFFVLFISIISLTYLARRSALGTVVGFVISAYFLNLISRSKSKIFRYFPLILILGVFLLFSRYMEDSKEILFNKIESRLSEDTRSGVFENFFYYLKDNLFFGHGMNGTYYSPLLDTDIEGEEFSAVEFRNIIENGYLQLMLTGGIMHIILFLLVLLPAAVKGVFMSSNQFTRACGIIIFLRLADMLVYGLPSLTLSYIIVWICVGVCYKTSLRKLTNDDIRNEFLKIEVL